MLQLKKFPGIPVSTREEARKFRPHPEEPRFRLLAREEGFFPCVFGKEFPAFTSHLKRRRSPQERREELQGRATIPRVPQMSQSIPRKTIFPALPRLSSRGSTHTTVARGTALWESLVGKPGGKASRERHRSLDPREWKRDTAATAREESARACPRSRRGLTPLGRLRSTPRSMSALERNSQVRAPTPHKVLSQRDTAAAAREDSARACPRSRRGLTPLVRVQKYPNIHVSTLEIISGSGTHSIQDLRPRHRRERNPERPPRNSHGDWPFLRPPERVPEVPVVSREHLQQLEKIQEVLPSRRDEAHFR